MTEVKGTEKNGDSLTGVVVPIGEEVRPPELEVRNGSPWDAQTKQLRYHRVYVRTSSNMVPFAFVVCFPYAK